MLTTAIPTLASLSTEKTVAFYTEKLGFTFHSDWDGYLILSKDNIFLHFWTTDDESIPKNTACYINVTEVDALFEKYKAQGVIHPEGALTDMPWEMRQFSIIDNNGNLIHFGQDISGEV